MRTAKGCGCSRGAGLPVPSRRTFASSFQASALCMSAALRHPAFACFHSPLEGTGNPSRVPQAPRGSDTTSQHAGWSGDAQRPRMAERLSGWIIGDDLRGNRDGFRFSAAETNIFYGPSGEITRTHGGNSRAHEATCGGVLGCCSSANTPTGSTTVVKSCGSRSISPIRTSIVHG